MNCKPGDLAIIIRDIEGWDHERYPGVTFLAKTAGRIVTVASLDVGAEDPSWLLEKPFDTLVTANGVTRVGAILAVGDDEVRPIRDQPGEDETLTWAGLPNKAAQPA